MVALSGLTLTGCLNDDNLIGENCYDEILNNGEELVDCGGSHLRSLRSLRERGIRPAFGRAVGGLWRKLRTLRR